MPALYDADDHQGCPDAWGALSPVPGNDSIDWQSRALAVMMDQWASFVGAPLVGARNGWQCLRVATR